MTRIEGYQSKPEEVYASSINMFFMAFVVSGLIIQIVYFRCVPGLDLPFLLNKYDSFSQAWYEEVGSTIVITLSLMIFSSPLGNIGLAFLGSLRRCFDRGCTCNRRRTR